jgi:hypothetical protein
MSRTWPTGIIGFLGQVLRGVDGQKACRIVMKVGRATAARASLRLKKKKAASL